LFFQDKSMTFQGVFRRFSNLKSYGVCDSNLGNTPKNPFQHPKNTLAKIGSFHFFDEMRRFKTPICERSSRLA
jgi:hypothetical protein